MCENPLFEGYGLLGRTFCSQDESASAAEGCLSEHKRCPQGLKPVLCWVVNVRAEARTLQKGVLTQTLFSPRENRGSSRPNPTVYRDLSKNTTRRIKTTSKNAFKTNSIGIICWSLL
jgi:hypothetical protein